jgi:glycosyltransferase involved in cell wall biosynthesis
MDLTIALEHRFTRTPDGAVWTSTGLSRGYWSRYLGSFRRVRLLARVQHVPAADPRWLRVDVDRVELAPVPHYLGPKEYLRRRRAVDREVRAALAAHPSDAVILRVPGNIGAIAAGALSSAGRPFGLEVVGDPFEVFAPGAVEHPLRPFFRWWSTRRLRELCATSSARLYVTSYLQRRYPPPPEEAERGRPRSATRVVGRGSFSASDVEMGEDAFVQEPRGLDAPAGPPFRIVTIATLAQLYKSPDVLIRAVARCAAEGLDVELVIVGDGRYRGALEQLAGRLWATKRVRFTGQLPSGAPVRRELDQAHLFILPSRTEGMPRAMIEAMARGLPCIGTPVGGIPELLPSTALVPIDPEAIAVRVREVAGSAELRSEMSRRNLARARDFHERTLQPIREAFYRHLMAATDCWAGRGRLTVCNEGAERAAPT